MTLDLKDDTGSSACLLFVPGYGHLPELHSFPTRRSSDLTIPHFVIQSPRKQPAHAEHIDGGAEGAVAQAILASTEATRSEEHTSELQSHSDLVCRLLLEKKNYPAVKPNRPTSPTDSGNSG